MTLIVINVCWLLVVVCCLLFQISGHVAAFRLTLSRLQNLCISGSDYQWSVLPHGSIVIESSKLGGQMALPIRVLNSGNLDMIQDAKYFKWKDSQKVRYIHHPIANIAIPNVYRNACTYCFYFYSI